MTKAWTVWTPIYSLFYMIPGLYTNFLSKFCRYGFQFLCFHWSIYSGGTGMRRGFLSMHPVDMSNDKFLLCFSRCKWTLSMKTHVLLAGDRSVSIVSTVLEQVECKANDKQFMSYWHYSFEAGHLYGYFIHCMQNHIEYSRSFRYCIDSQ